MKDEEALGVEVSDVYQPPELFEAGGYAELTHGEGIDVDEGYGGWRD
ncbi:lasso RiPP family leader peptide-containing protein [Streptomyces sp. UNOC14_S4]|nr:lasso RiPP family leader peptide-containing protein [Streptomyces sp. UNOC14_S4]MCC3772046.1 lasso RiPP family leader peptide-containing protein [Streptomyces sp. UNOC14_S4]